MDSVNTERSAYDYHVDIMNAATTGQLDIVKSILEKYPNYLDDSLCAATYGNQMHIIEWAIQQGSTCWDTALRNAAYGGHKHLMEYFIEKGSQDWNAGLCGAVQGNHAEVAELFIQKGANDLMRALESAHKDMIMFLVDKGAHLDTAVEKAVKYDDYELVKMLVEKGPEHLGAAIMEACYRDNKAIVELLLSKMKDSWRVIYTDEGEVRIIVRKWYQGQPFGEENLQIDGGQLFYYFKELAKKSTM